MQATRVLRQYKPMIQFLGKRTIPQKIDHTPHVHPAAPTDSLPESFAEYRQKAQQHGPLKGGQVRSASPAPASSASSSSSSSSSGKSQVIQPYGAIGGHSGKDLGSVAPKKGEFWDRSDLPKRFRRLAWSEADIEAIESGGASLVR